MPGILPMKVIKVGTNAQSRIAQACDRCRSKKIRCDGVRPCCSQCANVGFECKTSDKLSRRAFPRGYTESLEERVRVLECEVRELKELLDEKDEKIDMLSRIHSQSSQPIHQLPSPRRPSTTSIESRDKKEKEKEGVEAETEQEEVFKVQQSPYLLDSVGSDSYFAGTSSSRTFIEAFKHKVQEKGRSTEEIDTEGLLKSSVRDGEKKEAASEPATPVTFKAPPRLVSDQLINVFFQEWAPLFPVLHRPTFLGLYEKYVTDSDAVTDKAEIAQLNLVFGVAALSNGTRASDDLQSFERQWRAAIDAILKESSMATLQALVLAQLFCVQKGDLTGLLTYKGLATTLSARLGLHQSQKRFALGTLTCETRKKVFWTLYTVDCFTAVVLGLPKHIKDEDIQCEYPVDADDEYVSERGFQPTLPGESTKLSSALALFRAARILSKVLEEVFPAKASYELTLKKLADLSDELDAWSTSLPPHLRLHFAQDKPSTGTISSRSPLLSLTYHFIRALIQRPAICASLGSKSSSHMITLASSCKHMIQIVQLLKERGMSFSFCLSKDELLVLSGFGLLFQGLSLDSASKILKDNQKMVFAVADILDKSSAPCAPEFRKVAQSFFPAATPKRQSSPKNASANTATLSRHNSDGVVAPGPTSSSLPSSTKKQLKAIASRFTADPSKRKPTLDAPDNRRATVHNISLHPQGVPSQSTPSLQPTNRYDPASMSRSEPARSPVNMFSRPSSTTVRPSAPPPQLKPKSRQQPPLRLTNLDYLSFGNEPEVQPQPHRRATQPVKPEPGPTDWEKLLGSLDNGQTNIYDACYGGPAVEALLDNSGGNDTTMNPNNSNTITAPAGPTLYNQQTHQNHPNTSTPALNDINWNTASAVQAADLWALCQTDTNTSGFTSHHPDSLLSFSSGDEGGFGAGSSGEEFGACNDWVSVSSAGGSGQVGSNLGVGSDMVRGIVMPADFEGDGGLNFDGWEGGLNL